MRRFRQGFVFGTLSVVLGAFMAVLGVTGLAEPVTCHGRPLAAGGAWWFASALRAHRRAATGR